MKYSVIPKKQETNDMSLVTDIVYFFERLSRLLFRKEHIIVKLEDFQSFQNRTEIL